MFSKAIFSISIVLAMTLSCSKPTKDDWAPFDCQTAFDAWSSWSPDGRYIVYQRSAHDSLSIFRYGQISIWMYDTQTGKHGFFVGPGYFPRWNPQGNILAFNLGQTIYFYYPEIRYVRQVTDSGEIFDFSWSSDGAELVFNGCYRGECGCLIVDTLGNRVRNILPGDYRVAGVPSWSQAGDRILLSVSDSLTHSSVILIDTLGNFIRQVLPYSEIDVWGSQLSWSSSEDRFAINVNYTDDEGESLVDVRIFDMQGQMERNLGSGSASRWSPDDSKLVFHRGTVMIPQPDRDHPGCSRITVWTCNADGSEMHELLAWPQQEPDSTIFDGGYNWLNPLPR